MASAASSRKSLSTFSARCPVEVMPPRTRSDPDGDFLQSLVRGERGQALRRQLGARYPDCPADFIEDAIQNACQSFLDEADGISAPGQVYTWLRTAALRHLNREADRHRREVAVDPSQNGLDQVAAEASGPAEELIALEDDADLTVLVEKVSSSLTDRQRDVLALYANGYRRPQIADRLGVPERDVKEQLRLIMSRARGVLASLAGGGCNRGEPLVMRFICGISSPEESAKAREHLSRCGRCEQFSERLVDWREKAGAMLPAPVAEGTDPGVLGRIGSSAWEKLWALKQHAASGSAQIKQQATASYYRAADPSPLTAARPGTVGAVIASCLAIGGGATYCVQAGVDPLGAAKGLVASASEGQPEQEAPPPDSVSTGPAYTPAAPPVVEEPAPAPEPAPQPAPEPQPEPQPEPEPEPPAPEDSFEPTSTYTSEPESGSDEAGEAPAPSPAAEPAPVPAGSGPQLGGP